MFDDPPPLNGQPLKAAFTRTMSGWLDRLMILDTDLFYDPDDLAALLIAAETVPNLVVITADETRGRRARLARYALDQLGRTDVPVIAGLDLGGEQRFLMDDYLDGLEPQPDDLVDAVARVCAMTTGPIDWVGMGPMTNYAAVVTAAPELAERFVLYQMGGWLDRYRDKRVASHNLRTDTVAAGLGLRVAHKPRLMLSDFTNVREIRITPDWAVIRSLRSSPNAAAQLLAANFELWFARRGGSWMHDPLALTLPLQLPFVTMRGEWIRIEKDARIYRDLDGRVMEVSCAVDYPGFIDWFHESLLAGAYR
ncbi:nucleoside hydrolase [Nocardia iowensis]|uniref:Nucleoside hydrolase n=1 Tax=Nocardia iowensis TaxID=204891 RepID=A0ABX8S010_NOCIO|nr:nucleoside hydrolase [Nocardia iowensis]QXN94731.1 nucleoside hydrolase [Nocardia iowensis]